MKTLIALSMLAVASALVTHAQQPPVDAALPPPIAAADLVFEERDGVVAVEAEHFYKQTLTDQRAFHLITAQQQPKVRPDADAPHVKNASGGAYLEILPDTRATAADKLVAETNFTDKPGVMATLHYKVHFNTPGKYYVWARTYSTGAEDNGVHVGIDGEWPESGRRWQTTQKNAWAWDSRQRTVQNHNGEPFFLFLDVPTPGEHEIAFSMREDGFEFDKWILAQSRDFKPTDVGPPSVARQGKIPAVFAIPENYVESSTRPTAPTPAVRKEFTGLALNSQDFPVDGTGFYRDRNRWLAINPERDKEGRTKLPFGHPAGRYDVTLHCVGESDGRAMFEVKVADRKTGTFECPLSPAVYEEGKQFTVTWPNVEIGTDDPVEVYARIASEHGSEFSRARWIGLTFAPAGKTPDSP